jgi:glycyl-tRNA synthetase alpha subunit
MASSKNAPTRSPRSRITIERMPATYDTILLGAHATRVLASVDGVSAVRIEDQYVDLAMLSYAWSEPARGSAGIDRTLWRNGMRRVG